MGVAFPLCVWKAQATLKQETTPRSHKADLEELALIVTMSPACTPADFHQDGLKTFPGRVLGLGRCVYSTFILSLCSAAFPNGSCLIPSPAFGSTAHWTTAGRDISSVHMTQKLLSERLRPVSWHLCGHPAVGGFACSASGRQFSCRSFYRIWNNSVPWNRIGFTPVGTIQPLTVRAHLLSLTYIHTAALGFRSNCFWSHRYITKRRLSVCSGSQFVQFPSSSGVIGGSFRQTMHGFWNEKPNL